MSHTATQSKGGASAISLAVALLGLVLESFPNNPVAQAGNVIVRALPEAMIAGGAFYAAVSSPIKKVRKLLPWKK